MKPTTWALSPLNFGSGAASTIGVVAGVVVGAAACSMRICCWRVAITSNCCTMYCRICSMVGGAGGCCCCCCCCCLDMLCDVKTSVGDGGGKSLSSSSSSSLYEDARSSLSERIVARLN